MRIVAPALPLLALSPLAGCLGPSVEGLWRGECALELSDRTQDYPMELELADAGGLVEGEGSLLLEDYTFTGAVDGWRDEDQVALEWWVEGPDWRLLFTLDGTITGDRLSGSCANGESTGALELARE